MTDDELRDVVSVAIERLNSGDIDGFVALLDDDAMMVSSMATLTGRTNIAEALRVNQGLLSDSWRTVDKLVVSGSDVATWLTAGGVVAASGRRWDLEQCTIWQIHDGRIELIREYADWRPLIAAFTPG
jgi:ketosteroid isomerase-like protein